MLRGKLAFAHSAASSLCNTSVLRKLTLHRALECSPGTLGGHRRLEFTGRRASAVLWQVSCFLSQKNMFGKAT